MQRHGEIAHTEVTAVGTALRGDGEGGGLVVKAVGTELAPLGGDGGYGVLGVIEQIGLVGREEARLHAIGLHVVALGCGDGDDVGGSRCRRLQRQHIARIAAGGLAELCRRTAELDAAEAIIGMAGPAVSPGRGIPRAIAFGGIDVVGAGNADGDVVGRGRIDLADGKLAPGVGDVVAEGRRIAPVIDRGIGEVGLIELDGAACDDEHG